jgi:hypothetical protein
MGVALAFQVAFFVIGWDPVRHRSLMIPAVLEKLGFAIPALVLFGQGGIGTAVLIAGMMDLFLGVLFVVVFATAKSHTSSV